MTGLLFFSLICFAIAGIARWYEVSSKQINHDTQFRATLKQQGKVVVDVSYRTRARKQEDHDAASAVFRAGAQAVISRWALEIEPPPDDRHYKEITAHLHDHGMEIYEEVVTAINFVDLPPIPPSKPDPIPLSEVMVQQLDEKRGAADALLKSAGLNIDLTGKVQGYARERIEDLFEHPDHVR